MFVANYTIVDWGSYGIWLSNCSDDINSTKCDYVTQVTWRVTNSSVKHFHGKGLLGWLDGRMAPPLPRIVLNKQIGLEQWDIWKLAASTEKLENWTRYFTETRHNLSNYSFRCNLSYFIQAFVPLPFVIAIGNLQFNKTLCSVICVDYELYTCQFFYFSKKQILFDSLISTYSVVANRSPATLGRRTLGRTLGSHDRTCLPIAH